MKKIAVVYWSGTGNTEKMAEAVFKGAESAGAEASLFNVNDFSADMADNFDVIAFGCPSMGAEVLEEAEFEPVYSACRDKLTGKTVGIFGSYGWGDGEWMRNWEEDVLQAGASVPHGYLIINETPDDAGLETCKNYGINLVK
ncbi:MAG: flavodoxin [Clostridiales bacterium]|jgi:flavodoxin short chain|uniref:flavodoxin n=1 Tax=Aminipila sp. TaxID=2060095 RepID=UPI001D42F935|nr:flavodoxin [Aminipila sp.]MBE6033090.1 flavodoxin [Clostridiales bacterium]